MIMKTKKFISVLSLILGLLVSVCAFTACGSDDDNNDSSSNPLVGTWRAEVEEKGELQYWEMTFNANNTFTYREYNKDDNTIIHDSGSGKYELVSSNSVKITYADGEVVTSRFKITDGNKFEFLDADHGIIYYKIK